MTSIGKRWCYEDFEPGAVLDLGALTVTEQEIVDFATQFDPQPMHLDRNSGEASVLGGLSASGFHIMAMMMRLLYDNLLRDSLGQGSPGVEFIRYRRPVLAGDTISLAMTVDAKRESRSKPTMGLVTFTQNLSNQHGEEVSETRCTVIFLKRPEETPL